MNRIFVFLLLILSVGFTNVSHATCTGDCAQYCGNGYCTDYIEYRLQTRQTGDAGDWSGNVISSDVQAGDVAIFDFSTYGHVALIENVDGNYITISEWNWSNQYTKPTSNINCAVTDNFNITTSRKILKTQATRFWRPNTNTVSYNPFRRVANVAWRPANRSCLYANEWIYYSSGYPNGAQSINSLICHQEQKNMMNALGGLFSNWWNIIYSPSDLVNSGTCSAN